jgi:EAL domain-containing protein (putative c-di-GMP-specific phosphodiesterase class I)
VSTMGCDVVQGYLYAHPMPIEQLTRWLDEVSTLAPIRFARPLGGVDA